MEDFLAQAVAFMIFGGVLFVFFFVKEMFKGKDDTDDME
jgi:hypothetical protein